MNIKNISIHICQILVIGLALTACTLDSLDTGIKPLQTEQRLDAYPVNFDCAVAGYDDEGKTRAMSYNWDNMTTIFARFKSGSTYYYGFLTYENNGWSLVSTTDFLDLTTSGAIELYYFKESNGDYYYLNLNTECFDIYNNGSFVKSTSLAWNNNSFDFSEGTAVYLTRSGTNTYTHTANNGGFTVNATLEPGLWRMRFSGTNGTTITMPAAENDIQYLSSFNWYGSDDVSFSGDAKDISLKVSNNYTPYIYGQFISTSNKITVKNGNDTYTRNLSTTNLYAGISGCFTLPTSSNYSSAGWTKVVNEIPMSLKDMLEKPMGTVNIDMKTASYQAIRDEIAKSYTIVDYTTDEGKPWFSLKVEDNASCSNMTYQGLTFNHFNIFKWDTGPGIYYYFMIDKSKASNNYTSYLNKIIQDFKNLNISLNANSSTSELADYTGFDSAKNYYSVSVSDYVTEYKFIVYVSYENSNKITANPSIVTVHGKERDYIKDDDHPNGTGNMWDNQLFINANRALRAGEKTVVEFDYLSSIDATVSTHCHKNPGDYVYWGCIGTLTFTPKEQHFSITFQIPADADGMKTIAFNMAEIKSACNYTIKNVIWKLKDDSETLIDMSGTKNFYLREGAGDIIHEY